MKYCDFNGCRNKIAKGQYCKDHRREKKKAVTRVKYDTSNKPFYNSAIWRAKRQEVYERERGCCQRCGRFVFGKLAQVHHIVKVKDNSLLKLQEDNLCLLCPACHMVEEYGEKKEKIILDFFNPPTKK